MVFNFKTDSFSVQYTASEIEHPVLWESHCHAQYEMIAVADGDITVMLEGKNYRLKKNQIIIIPPLLYHSVTVNERGCYRRITALFLIDAIPRAIQKEFIEQRIATINAAQPEKIKDVVCQNGDRIFYAPLVESLMIEILYDVLKTPTATTESKTDEFLQKALQYIDEHLSEKILLDDLARHTARSKSSFCHLFEKKMNISPKQYILQKKLAIASKLIEEGMPHTVAAMQVGYENYSNFYRLYKRSYKKQSRS